MRTTLAAMCVLTLLAIAYLSVSVLVLRPPRPNLAMWFTLAAIFGTQGVLTLTALALDSRSARLRYAVLTGGGILAAIGAWMVRETLTSPHFEGYALVLGSMLVVQGALTLVGFRQPSSA